MSQIRLALMKCSSACAMIYLSINLCCKAVQVAVDSRVRLENDPMKEWGANKQKLQRALRIPQRWKGAREEF